MIVEVEFGCVGIPLSVEVIVRVLALCLIPLVRGDCYLGFVPCPSSERLILCGLVPCLLCRACICLREELYTPSCICPNPQ